MSSDDRTADSAWTLGRLLTWTTQFLQKKGVDNPRLDAEVLLAHARGCRRIDLYTAFEEESPEALREEFRKLVRRRAQGEPVAYLVGYREFFSLTFLVTPDVLIPRPETELMVVRAVDLAKEITSDAPLKIVDVGTGCGVLAICCAKHIPDALITAIDISTAALNVAKKNAVRLEVESQIEFIESDLLSAVPAQPECDLIISNPPYVASSDIPTLQTEVRDFEPYRALDGGERGTEIIERLIPQAAERLKPGGWLLLEVGPDNARQVEQLFDATPDLTLHKTMTDLAGLPRVVQAQRIS